MESTPQKKKLDLWSEEPFLVFFPLGFLASAIGVLLWPAYAGQLLDFYPLEAHARFMTLGFAGCLITGFLGTAGPRLLESSSWCRFEVAWHVIVSLAMMGALLVNRIAVADLLTGFWLLGVLFSLGFRFLMERQDTPPPGMVLAVAGLTGAALAGFALSMNGLLSLSFEWFTFWRLLYFQGLIWLPVLGVAPFLLPRFFNKSSRHSLPTSLRPPDGWHRRFGESVLAGGLLVLSFVIEAWFDARIGMVLRGVVVAGYLALAVPGLFEWCKANALAMHLRFVVLCALGGWLLAASFLSFRIGMLHLMFIGGAGLLLISAATRVVLGHHERQDRLALKMRWFYFVGGLVILSALTRVSLEFMPLLRISHLNYAATAWVLALVLLGWQIFREINAPRQQPSGQCPRRKKRGNSSN